MIGFYGDNVQRMLLPHYLEYSIDAFAKNQKKFRIYAGHVRQHVSVRAVEQMGKQNVAMFEQAMRMFTPFDGGKATEQTNPAELVRQPEAVQSLQDQLNALQAHSIR